MLELNEYHKRAQQTALYRESAVHTDSLRHQTERIDLYCLNYVVGKLNGEAGELIEEVCKAMRDDYGVITEERRTKMIKELGDVLWYVAAICEELNIDLEAVAMINLDKLEKRAQEGKLRGSGSDR